MLGRRPSAAFTVARRCPHGGPAVIESEPFDDRGHPFPTRYWLVCRPLVAAVSRLEAAGGVTAFDADEALADTRHADHEEHARRHHGYRIAGAGDAGHSKCLHAHLAFGLALGPTAATEWIWRRSGAAWPDACCAEER